MRVIYFSIILMYLFSVSAECSDWEYVCSSVGKKVFVDKGSIEYQSKSTVRAWLKFECEKNCDPLLKELKEYVEFDCSNSKVKGLQQVQYYTDGNFVVARFTPASSPYLAQHYSEVIYEYLCKHKKSLEE